jgi:membrane fusion protein (multidrug efflux system)
MKKLIIVLIILVAAGLALYKFVFSPKVTYQEAKVEQKDLEVYLNSSGKVRAVREQTASFPISGQVEMIATSGASFKSGEIVARLKTADLWAALQGAYAALNKARSSFYYYLEAKGQADRAYGWKEDKDSKSFVSQANNNVTIAQDGVESAQFAVEAAKASYNKAFVRAQFDGVVGQSLVRVGETVVPGQTVLMLLDPSSFYFESEVDEVDVKATEGGQKAKIKLDSYPGEEFDGEVYVADLTPHTTNSGGTAYYARISFNNVPKSVTLRPGLNGEVRLLSQVIKGALVVPATFVTPTDGKNQVLLRPGNGLGPIKREVEVGEFVDGQYEIKKGLNLGDIVAAPVKK